MRSPVTFPEVFFPPTDGVGGRAVAVALGTLGLALASFVSVPMVPVPVTMQTFAVTLVGALFGWRLGGFTVLAWLLEAAAGAPVLAGGASGLHNFVGPTAGYLWGFPVVAVIVGLLVERGWGGARPMRALFTMLIGNLLCLALGAAWLVPLMGASAAVAAGVTPFLLGGALKSALGAAVLRSLSPRRG
ncbi:MAG: biotin transporter BioY [Janthinobacterium lividum]